MVDDTVEADRPGSTGQGSETRGQIRGSSLLLAGRVVALGANLLTQVLIARYLLKSEFGAFAYALSIVSLFESVVALGLDRAIPRFLPLYEERRQFDRFLGTLVFVVGTILGLGLAIVLLVIGWQALGGGFVIEDPLAITLLGILILLAPIQALDAVLTDLFAVFASARTIFVRKYVLGPGLRLLVVVLLALGGLGVTFLAVGYVAAGALGILLYVGLVPGMLRRRGILDKLRAARPRVEFREILAYTLPLLTTDLVFVFMAAFDALLLGYFYGTEEVGALRVVESAARTNAIVALSFGVLFVPVATRYFARGDDRAMNDLYWQAATWTAVLSFPVFALTFSLAGPITVLLYEERYASSAIFLALLALGRYVDAAFGLNGLALRVYGRMRAVIVVNLFAAAFHLVVSLVLIPPLGALGAAIAVAATYIAHNVVKQVALRRTTPIRGFDLRYRVVFGSIAAMAAGLAVLQVAVDPPLVVTVAATGLAAVGVLFVARSSLGVSETFPELLRLPGMRFLLR